MDLTEKIVRDHLAHRGYTNVVYEPDGNVPPDFLVDNVIAVEVRRLNQNYSDSSGTRGLEEVAIPLLNKIKKLLESLGAPVAGESWFVFFRFKRPVEPWKTLEPKLRGALEAFSQSTSKQKGNIAKENSFELDVLRASKPHATMFVMGGYLDRQSGGWLLPKMEANIRHCVNEKSKKIANVRPKYPYWWLALVDHIGYALDDFDRERLREQISIEHDWDKILLIDPLDPTRWFEL